MDWQWPWPQQFVPWFPPQMQQPQLSPATFAAHPEVRDSGGYVDPATQLGAHIDEITRRANTFLPNKPVEQWSPQDIRNFQQRNKDIFGAR